MKFFAWYTDPDGIKNMQKHHDLCLGCMVINQNAMVQTFVAGIPSV